jgi:hypothetical protein
MADLAMLAGEAIQTPDIHVGNVMVRLAIL